MIEKTIKRRPDKTFFEVKRELHELFALAGEKRRGCKDKDGYPVDFTPPAKQQRYEELSEQFYPLQKVFHQDKFLP